MNKEEREHALNYHAIWDVPDKHKVIEEDEKFVFVFSDNFMKVTFWAYDENSRSNNRFHCNFWFCSNATKVNWEFSLSASKGFMYAIQ